MSKKDQPSKYLASFYPKTSSGQGNSGNSNAQQNLPNVNQPQQRVPARNPALGSFQGQTNPTINNSKNNPFPSSTKPHLTNFPSTSGPAKFPGSQKFTTRPSASYDAEKFKNPADFFKSSQSSSSQVFSSQNKLQAVKRTSFGGGGSTHEMLSQSFTTKKPQMARTGGSMAAPAMSTYGTNPRYPISQRSHMAIDQNVASTEALALQWSTKIMRQKKDGQIAGNLEKRNLSRAEGKSPLGKSFWADSSFSQIDKICKNQQNDPWYSNDVWGDDLPEEAIDACLLMASQKQPSTSEHDPLSSWKDEIWASPKKIEPPTHSKISSVKTSLFPDKNPTAKAKSENFMDLLAKDDEFLALIDKVESQAKLSIPSNSGLGFGSKGKPFPSQSTSKSNLMYNFDIPDRTSVPLSECMPVTSGNKSSFVIKAKEFESPSKLETLTQSQRTFRKPIKSLPSPTTTKLTFTTEWLRGQLEKISSEYSTLKEDVQVKEGESKLLREKLKTAEEEVQKHKLDKAKELEKLREAFEAKVKQLEKQLEATQTQAMFKAKEAESSLEKYRELMSVSVHAPQPAKCQSFKGIPSFGGRPGESSKTAVDQMIPEVLADETVSIESLVDQTKVGGCLIDETFDDRGGVVVDATVSVDIINETLQVFETPKKNVVEPTEDSPDVEMFEDFEKPQDVAELPQTVAITKKTYFSPTSLFDSDFVTRNEAFKKASARVVLGKQPKKELNHFLMPPMEYLSHMLLQTEFSEQEFENYLVRRPTLAELWEVPYDAFGDAVLDEYEKAAVGDAISADPARIILSKSRYFTTMESAHGALISLGNTGKWGPSEGEMSKTVVDLATTMVRELYATLGDPRLLRTTYTIYDRDPKILSEFLDSSELVDLFDPLSPEKWKDESFVELRRCLVMIGFLCSVDHMTARYIVNPKAYKSELLRDFYPPTQDLSQGSKRSDDDGYAVKITAREGQRKPGELKLMQMYRDLHSKKFTLVSNLASSFTSDKPELPAPPKITLDFDSSESNPEKPHETAALKALKSAIDSTENLSELRSGSFSFVQKSSNTYNPSFDEFKNCVTAFGLTLKENDVRDMVRKIKGELNPQKVMLLKDIASKAPHNKNQITNSYQVTVPDHLFSAVQSEILSSSGDLDILTAPVNRCITHLEKQLLQLALVNSKSLKNVVERSVDHKEPTDLDLTRYVSNSTEADFDPPRKRKLSVKDLEPRKSAKVADYKTPPFDTNLYSQIQKEPEEDVVMITDTQVLPSSPIEDDQLAKFEKREEMAELKRKMLAEEKKMETKPSRHALAPIRIPGRNSPTNDDSADREVAMEIEKMFQTQVKPDAQMDDSVWSSESEEELSEFRTVCSNENNVEIEFIPDLVKHFHNKLKNAGLLELLCEVFKEGGVLRFTHRLNGVILGTVLMLQKIVMYQRKEVEPCQTKLATIIREILYTRPSPRIVLEINILLRHAISLPGFTKMLCHNASPETFVTSNEQVYFTRGACLLEVVCISVTYATEGETNYTVYLKMIQWIYYIVCTEKKHMASLYEQHNVNRRRCMCITALNNTIVMILHRALSLYRKLSETRSESSFKRCLEKIFVASLQVLRLIYSYGSRSFLHTINTQLQEYHQVLTWFKDMHNNAVYEGFRLSPTEFRVVSDLHKEWRNPNPLPERPEELRNLPDFSRHFSPENPYDLKNIDLLMKTESSESEED